MQPVDVRWREVGNLISPALILFYRNYLQKQMATATYKNMKQNMKLIKQLPLNALDYIRK